MSSKFFFKNFSDKNIKLLVTHYQKDSSNTKIYEKILTILSPYVYNYARLRYRIDSDRSSDFFIYFFERFPKLLLKYKLESFLFLTWFNTILKNQFSNWKKSKEYNLKRNPYEQLFLQEEIELIVDFRDDKKQALILLEKEYNFISSREKVKELLSCLPDKLKYIFKLLYPDFITEKDFNSIAKIFNISLKTVLQGYDFLLKRNLKKYKRKQNILDKITFLNEKILKMEKILNKINTDLEYDKSEVFKEKLNKNIIFYKQKKIYNTQKYKKIVVQSKVADIAFVLNLKEQQVHNLIYRARIKLKEIIQKLFNNEKI